MIFNLLLFFFFFKVTPEVFSVFLKRTRTTSAVEAYNGVIGRIIQKNGNFFKFVKALIDEEFNKSRDFELLICSGGSHGTSKKKKTVYEQKSSYIEEASHKLLEGKITPKEFMQRMVFGKSKICVDLEPDEDIFETNGHNSDNEDDNDSEDENDDGDDTVDPNTPSHYFHETDTAMCIVCLVSKPNILLLPCRHLKICLNCCNELKANAGENFFKCPLCRAIVVENLTVFT